MTNYTQTANVMDMVNFTCNVTGFPYTSTQISWIFPPSTLDDRININTVIGDDYVVSTLTIKSIQLTDAGLYKCAASVEGLVGNILFNLTVGMCISQLCTYMAMHNCTYVHISVHTYIRMYVLQRIYCVHNYVKPTCQNDFL